MEVANDEKVPGGVECEQQCHGWFQKRMGSASSVINWKKDELELSYWLTISSLIKLMWWNFNI